MEKDSENALLWKFTRRRLEAEEIRDSMLAVSGRLNPKAGGPSVMVPIDQDLVKMLKRPQYWVATRDKSEYDRRTHLHDLQAQSAAAVHGRVRCAGYAAFLPAAGAIDARSAGAGDAERRDFERAGAGVCGPAGARRRNQRRRASIVRGAWPSGRPPTPKEKALALQFLAEKPDDPTVLKELALDVFNLNAFLYVN